MKKEKDFLRSAMRRQKEFREERRYSASDVCFKFKFYKDSFKRKVAARQAVFL
jgi:hypothetical protein